MGPLIAMVANQTIELLVDFKPILTLRTMGLEGLFLYFLHKLKLKI
jgi:hypothetical protein